MIIAEIGGNFCGSIPLAKKLIQEAFMAGADKVKVQLYDADKLYKGTCYYRYGKETELTYAQLLELKKFADDLPIELFASVFDVERVKWCEALGFKRYKIAARERNPELLEEVVATGKPVIISSDPVRSDIVFLVGVDVDALYCVSKYPAMQTDIQFPDFSDGLFSGFSDHTIGIETALCALGRGARIIEKHFTMDRFAYGFDHLWSMTPGECKQLVKYERMLKELYGEDRSWVKNNQ